MRKRKSRSAEAEALAAAELDVRRQRNAELAMDILKMIFALHGEDMAVGAIYWALAKDAGDGFIKDLKKYVDEFDLDPIVLRSLHGG